MHLHLKPKMLVIALLTIFTMPALQAQSQMENIDRGLVAVRTSSSQVFLSWRMLGTDPSNVSFNLYRGSTLITNTNSTNYVDNTSTNSNYTVRSVIDGTEQGTIGTASTWSSNYLRLPLQTPSGYTPNDCSVGDLDGDGTYEIVMKMEGATRDNSQSGTTDPVYLQAYELNGTFLWSIDLGINIRGGAHYTQFIVYDLDGDGQAEIACKTAPGTQDGTGSYLSSGPASSDNDNADYRNSSGYILDGPEYLTVFNGQSGAEITTVDYVPPRGNVSDWGDSYGNRVDRFLATTAYLNGTEPSLVMCRGYYTRSVLAAWDFDGTNLTQRWVFDTDDGYPDYEGQGAHSISVGDADGDGRDEIMYGACAIDDDGTPLYNTNFMHGDATHLGDLIPGQPGLEFYMPSESAGYSHDGITNPGVHVRNAGTGSIIWSIPSSGDIGRAMTADISAAHAGNEFWAADGLGVYNSDGQVISSSIPPINFAVWWDGDDLREMLDGTTVSKWGSGNLLSPGGVSSNNGTKATPALSADILGDWREEVIWRESDNSALRIYTTTNTTNRRLFTLMHDRQYRQAIAWQNVAYNQPPHPSFFIGDGMSTPPQPNIYLVGDGNNNGGNCDPTTITPYLQVDGGTWQQTSSVTIDEGSSVQFGPNPAQGGSWSWSGCGTSGSSREQTVSPGNSCTATATYTNDCGTQSTQDFQVTVSSSSSTVTIQENTTGFCNVDGTVDDNNTGYSGSGFANTDNASGNGIEWRIDATSDGTHTVTFRFANGGSSNRPGDLLIDGTPVASNVAFNTTGSWTTWNETAIDVNIGSGIRSIELVATGSDGLANIDWIRVSDATTADCSQSGGGSSGGSGENGAFNGTYSIVASHSDKAFDTYNWGTSNGTNIVQWAYWGGETQQYDISQVDGDWHRITPVIATDQALDVDGISTADGANIHTWSYLGGENQQFSFQSAGTGVWQIVARHSGKCLEVESGSTADGANVIQQTCNSSASHQIFEVTGVSNANNENLANELQEQFHIYPSPATDILHVNVPDDIANRIDIAIINHIGQQVMMLDQVRPGINSIDIKSLDSGLYFTKMKYDNNTVLKKFIKQ